MKTSRARCCAGLLAAALLVATGAASAGDYLGELAWPAAAAALPKSIVIIPIAAGAKEHGPHLPLNTDAIVLDALLQTAAESADVLIAPPILHGWFPAFREYPGTEVADATIFQGYVEAVSLSLVKHGATRLVYLNTGITRATGLPLSIVARDMRADHDVHTLVLSWDDLEDASVEPLYEQQRGGHADEGETSIMLYLRPDLVVMEKARADYREPPRAQLGYAPGKFSREVESGVFGDPTLATAAKGEAILNAMRNNLKTALAQFAAL